ncbi:unnamed protein product [Acanthoscelides obtectus]|uniref:tRNA-dihydrouridine(47) synthase [NAD(P)(+)] n=1 Tax=Acanthoscelides obtectus TaxID=200917 RepID=A0A9P0JKB7_ACAOB|nr:unnamed protein product [Acanthoscelides obtectus]CAK1639938.1 tRNA-dihydrouridine(47) synthase [NAD(P)(+)]-like [Acanthoscelides obtectus]
MEGPGICQVKSEFILPAVTREINLSHVSNTDKRKLEQHNEESTEKNAENVESSSKRQRLSKAEKKKLRGQNKSRAPTYVTNRSKELCICMIDVPEGNDIPGCNRNKCNFIHDIDNYLTIKPKDIGEHCYNFETFGKCNRGLACRFGSEHITPSGRNIINEQLYSKYELQTRNNLGKELQLSLKKRHYDFKLAEQLVKHHDHLKKEKSEQPVQKPIVSNNVTQGAITDEDIIKLRQREKRKIDWSDKLYLSPLTTVGNLPFRRICKEYGADITCGEMAMCSSLLQGESSEWALVKRHKSEDLFGIQLCANNSFLLTKCGQLLLNEIDVDFVDLNMGCPIDLVYRQGGGCGLLHRERALELCIRSMSDILTVPFTVKTRTGVYSGKNIAHTMAPKFREWGVSMLTIHGRSREQRYTKQADWNYIQTVAEAASPMPVFGNGDILSYEDYIKAREVAPAISGVMIGRGALIKPWIFQEIKETKLYDISSSERFDILKKYVNYGLEHWGSDNKGVENTRRFLLEWLSFLYRYVPVGLLEDPPQKINQRPPHFRGRDDLETLMASPSASDWIKISEMLLGPVPENFQFLPKHKANSYN